MRTLRFALSVWACWLAILALPAAAHDIPAEARVRAFVKSEDGRLHVLLRLPLSLLLNVDFPKQGPGYLALAHVDEGLGLAVTAADRGIDWFENGRRLSLVRQSARISLPSDKSFSDFESARALLQGPRLPNTTYVFWNQGYFDAYLIYELADRDGSIAVDFHIAPALKDRLKFDLRYQLPDRSERAFELSTGEGRIVLDPRWYQASWTFLQTGFEHILSGPDHLLFLLCLVLPFRRIDVYLIGVVSAFTIGHSLTLLAAAYGWVPGGAWFAPLIEVLIAVTILLMAVENVLSPRLQRRWLASAMIGLVHGFGFSFVLQSQLQFAGSSLLLSLLAFNVGIELGQLLVLAAIGVAVAACLKLRPAAERPIVILVSVLAGHVAWHWLAERFAALAAVAPEQPGDLTAFLAGLVAAGFMLWWGVHWLERQRLARVSGVEVGRSRAGP